MSAGVAGPDCLVLRDGTELCARPLEPADAATLAAAFASLSPQSRYRRFLAPKPRLTPTDLRLLTALDHHHREALVAVEPVSGAWVGVARYASYREDPRTVDVAVTVGDAWQGRGAGTGLTRLLMDRARAAGVERVHAVTLSSNLPALAMLRRNGFRAAGRDGEAIEFVLELARSPARAPATARPAAAA